MDIATEVLKRGEARFDMVGQFLGYPLHSTAEQISTGLAARLVRYAERTLDAEGFLAAVKGWSVKVGTNDADSKPADRWYWVCWTNEKGITFGARYPHQQGVAAPRSRLEDRAGLEY